MSKGLVYIAGPMTGREHYNVAAFEAAAERWSFAGYEVETPFEANSRVWRKHYGCDFDPRTDTCDWGDPILSEMLAEDFGSLFRADIVALLPGWENSKGSKAELLIALNMGKQVMCAETHAPIAFRGATVTFDRVGGEPESVLSEAVRLTGGDRARDYGDPADDYAASTDAFNALTRRDGERALSPAEGAIYMCCVKLAREGHRPKRDNRVDLAGYAWVLDRCRLREAA
jgi:hypothetical protein